MNFTTAQLHTNAYPRLVETLRAAEELRPILLKQYGAVPECVLDFCNKARALLRELEETK